MNVDTAIEISLEANGESDWVTLYAAKEAVETGLDVAITNLKIRRSRDAAGLYARAAQLLEAHERLTALGV